ncbi:ribonuclease H-like domain-containing protein [Heyndrickxia acidiproducens]|uniref:ribonuclease H-like domain-containing protein n=1 Tax=Heyndrickxia acidiproducens TaxID=1121084 RepID=UPI0003819AEA|nr:ribonuclease H-like domain-containing protein [Heyndrickxia acidiproducens]
MSSLKNKLNRMKTHIVKEQDVKSRQITGLQQPVPSIPYLDMWQNANTSPYFLDGEYCLIREVHYPLAARHGKYCFADFPEAVAMWNNSPVCHPLSANGFHAQDLFFFDTETTGLGGGAGNTIFLLGYAFFTQSEVVLKQHILPEPGLEIPLYYSFLENINYTTLVTYNGKAFDWPQVKTRHTLVRDHVPKLPEFGHFDLYHAARRLWRDELDSVKLANVERDILGFEREGDIPGFLAPMIYFDFVERKNPEGLIGILQHNELDILSLITLYTHLTFQILQQDPLQSAKEKRMVGKWFEYIGEYDAALHTYERAAAANDLAAKHRLAFQMKRRKELGRAQMLWTEVAKQARHEIKAEACIELAKLFEHQKRDFKSAAAYTEKALEIYECFISPGSAGWRKQREEAEKRLFRLNMKMKKRGIN